MFFINLLRWLRGYVSFTCTGGFTERFLNMCALHGIIVWNTSCCQRVLKGRVSKKQMKLMYPVAENSGTELVFGEMKGLPSLAEKNKDRGGLLIGLILFFVILKVMSMFVWTVEFTGADNISEAYLRETFSELGVYSGSYVSSLDPKAIERQAMLKLDNISWLSVNIHGSAVEVMISEKAEIPEIESTEKPCNIKAKKSGQIVQINTKAGRASCKVGDAVIKGQVLISGITESKMGFNNICHANGEVFANTSHEISISLPESYTIQIPVNEPVERKRLNIFNFGITYKPASQPKELYRSVYSNEVLKVFELKAPAYILTESMQEYKIIEVKPTEEQALAAAKALLKLKEAFLMGDITIKKAELSSRTEENNYVLKCSYDCIEDIGYKEEIFLQNITSESEEEKTDSEEESN